MSYGTLAHYIAPAHPFKSKVSKLIFSDADGLFDHGQLLFIADPIVGPLAENSPFYTLSWFSNKSKCTVRLIGAVEIYAASTA